jgi:hypothetical protein
MQASHQGFLNLRDGETSSIAWPDTVRDAWSLKRVASQVALVGKRVQCWTRTAVLDVASQVMVVGLAITERLRIGFTTGVEALDEVDESQMHLALLGVVQAGAENLVLS